MAATIASTPTAVRTFGSPRSLRVVAVVAASLIGMGGIAAAGAATLRPSADRGDLRSADTVVDDTVVDDTTTTTIPNTTTIPDVTIADETGVVPLVDDPATEFDETQCAEGNHGATVSSIAKNTPSGPGHGDEVSIAAHSSCGKNATDDATTTDDTTADTVADTLVDDPATEFDETQCAEGNHGATVSSIAKATPPGAGHGDEVSIAAHSSCGKDTDDDTTDDGATDDGTDTTVAATDDDSPGNSDGHGNSNGHGNGNGNSGGNGNGRGNGKPGG